MIKMDKINFGLDIVDIKRIKNLVDQYGNRFLFRIFSINEIEEAKKRGHYFSSLAGKFAAKEAFIKAFPFSKDQVILFSDIEILSDSFGKPWCYYKRVKIIHSNLSISHEKNYAIAGLIVF